MKSSFIIKTINNHIVTHTQSAFGLWGRAMMVAITPLKTVARVAFYVLGISICGLGVQFSIFN